MPRLGDFSSSFAAFARHGAWFGRTCPVCLLYSLRLGVVALLLGLRPPPVQLCRLQTQFACHRRDPVLRCPQQRLLLELRTVIGEDGGWYEYQCENKCVLNLYGGSGGWDVSDKYGGYVFWVIR